MFRPATLAAALCALALPALADPLPKGARPLSEKALAKMYAGTTLNWTTSRAYFAPDGSLKGIAGKNRLGDTLFWGRWTVKGNEVCMSGPFRNRTTGKTGTTTDCWKWFLGPDRQPWTLWSVHYDGSAPDLAEGYSREEITRMRRGDGVSATFDRLWKG